MKKKLVSAKDSIKYNLLTMNTSFYFNKQDKVVLFSQVYNLKTDLHEIFKIIQRIIYLSYRSEFTPIKSNKSTKQSYYTDCGWGCMLRSSQMLLANCIFEIKNYYNSQLRKRNFIETIFLFFDNIVNYVEIANNNDLITDELGKNEINELNIIKNTFLSPFSIQNICRESEKYDMYPGMWYSDITMINIFCDLNSTYKPIDDLEILSFREGVIYQDAIIKKCFRKVTNSSPSKSIINENNALINETTKNNKVSEVVNEESNMIKDNNKVSLKVNNVRKDNIEESIKVNTEEGIKDNKDNVKDNDNKNNDIKNNDIKYNDIKDNGKKDNKDNTDNTDNKANKVNKDNKASEDSKDNNDNKDNKDN